MRRSKYEVTAVAPPPAMGKFAFLPGWLRPLPRPITDNAKLLLGYASVGCVGTATHFAILYAALNSIGTVAASTLGAVAGCLVNFSLSQHLLFPGRQSASRAFPRFVVIAGLAVVLNAVLMKALIATLPVFSSQLVSTAAVFLFTFAFNNGWAFSERQN